MKIYFAGAFGYKFHEHLKIDVLESYFYLSEKHKQNINEHISKCSSFFLDSGAFSAFTQNAIINIDEYINFCLKNDIKYYSVLDKIGDAEGTLQNQKYMESKGARPIPCFHYGENFKYLDFYCKNYDYIALGGMVPITTKKLINWLDVIFSKYPNKKFHGFGLTIIKLMNRYNWFSVDSTSYLQGTKSASIYINGKCLTYNGEENDESKKFNFFDEKQFAYMCNKYNITPEQLRRSTEYSEIMQEKGYWFRCLYNIYFFIEYLENRIIKPFESKQNQLTEFGIYISQSKPSKEQLLIDARDYWIKENYGDIPKELGLKLWNHNRGKS